MFTLLASLLPAVFKVIDKVVGNAAEAEKMKMEFQRMAITGEMKEVEAAAKVLQTELSGSWMQRSWRPILMFSIIGIMVNNYLIYPYMTLFGVPVVYLDMPPALWNLMAIGVGGYIVGRSGEKIVTKWRNPDG